MRRLNSDLSDRSNENWRTPYLDIIAVGIIQFLLSLLILCYGVFLMQFILKDLYNLKTSLWTAILYIAISKIANPWMRSYCKHLDNVRHKVHKRNIVLTGILLFVNLVLLYLYPTPTCLIIFYGILGGLFSSTIYVHLESVTANVFKHYPHLFSILDQLTKTFCLLLMPQLVLLLTDKYGIKESFLILAAVALNIIPACLLIRRKKYRKKPLCKFQTVDRLSIEMIDLNTKPPVIEEPSSSEDEEDEDLEDDETGEYELNKSEDLSRTNVQTYFQNVGVKILPNIPEEDDDLEDDDDINEISSKRLSRISAILQEINESSHKPVNLSVTNLFQPDEIENEEPETNVSQFMDEDSQERSRCFSITSSTIETVKLTKRRLKSFFHKHCIRTIPRVLGSIQFYPALISSCITTLISTTVFATTPYLMFLNYENKPASSYSYTYTQESTFLLTIFGFSWLFFLAGYPIFNKLSSLKIKLLFLTGLLILGLSLFIVHKFSYDNFVLFSLTFGLGHGIVNYAENIANEKFCGDSKWRMLEGPLEITTGFIVILIYFVIYFSHLEIYFLLSYAYWLYISDAILWFVVYVLKKILSRFKYRGRYNLKQFSDFDF